MSPTSKIFTISSLNTVNLTGVIYFPNNRIDISNINNSGNNNNGCTVWTLAATSKFSHAKYSKRHKLRGGLRRSAPRR